VAVAAAIAGAAVVRARFGTALQRIEKAPLDFATDADVAAERAILDVLRAARPGDGYQGEELGESGAGRSGRRWLIDPLCGTANFAVTTPLTAVNVALCAGDRVLAAASADPLAGEVFWADAAAAWLRRGSADQPLTPAAESRLVEVNLDPPFPNGEVFRATALLASPGFAAASFVYGPAITARIAAADARTWHRSVTVTVSLAAATASATGAAALVLQSSLRS